MAREKAHAALRATFEPTPAARYLPQALDGHATGIERVGHRGPVDGRDAGQEPGRRRTSIEEIVDRTELSGATGPAAAGDACQPWIDWLAQAGTEIAMPLTTAIDGMRMVAASGRLDGADAARLLDDLSRARQAAIVAQQLVRVATGQARHVPERLDLAATLRAVIAEHRADGHARASTIVGALPAVTLEADPALVAQLVQTLLDWAHEHAQSPVHVSLDAMGAPRARPRLELRFRHAAPARPANGHGAPQAVMDTLAWRLLLQLATLLQSTVHRSLDADGCRLHVEFLPAAAPVAVVPGRRRARGGKAAPKPLAGHHVLVVTPSHDLRQDVQQAVRHLGLMIDVVASLDEARSFCRDGLPHAIVADATVGGAPLLALQRDLLAEAPGLAVIEVGEHHDGYRTSIDDAGQLARVGRASLGDGLPAVLLFELTRDA